MNYEGMFKTPEQIRSERYDELLKRNSKRQGMGLLQQVAAGRGEQIGEGIARMMGLVTPEEAQAEATQQAMSEIDAPAGSPEYYFQFAEALKEIDPEKSMQLMDLGKKKEIERTRLNYEGRRVDMEAERIANQVNQFNQNMQRQRERDAVSDGQWQRSFDASQERFQKEHGLRVEQFEAGKDQWERKFDNDRYEFILGHNYRVARDNIEDKQWRESFDRQEDQFSRTHGLAVDRFGLSKQQWEEMEPARQMELANAELGLQATELQLAGHITEQNQLQAYNNIVSSIPYDRESPTGFADYSFKVGEALLKAGLAEQGNNWLKQGADAKKGLLGSRAAPKYNQIEGVKDGVNGTYLFENGVEKEFVPAKAGSDSIEYSSAVEKSIERDSTSARDASARAQQARGTVALIDSAEQFNGGLPTYLDEQLKKFVGGRDVKSVMITELTRLRNSAAIQNLPKGPASDKDIALVLSGEIPAEFAGKEEALRYARGIAKLAQVEADYYTDRANWQTQNGNLAGFDAFTRYNADQQTLMGVNQDAMLLFWEGYHGGDPTIEQEFIDEYGFSPAKIQERMSADASVFEGKRTPR